MKKIILLIILILLILSFLPIFNVTTYPADAPVKTKVGLLMYLSVKLSKSDRGKYFPQNPEMFSE
jgi:hypothetical protein